MADRVVYILGAGFSAPLGLPVMSDFLLRSKDLFARDPDTYKGFRGVFKRIDEMSKAKNYLALDLHNIETILSILDMLDHSTGGTRERKRFISYLAETVSAFTPEHQDSRATFGSFAKELFDRRPTLRSYCYFLANLLGLSVRTTDQTGVFEQGEPPSPEREYGVITLNYDTVLENCLQAIKDQIAGRKDYHLAPKRGAPGLPFAKLHGSIDPLTIVPPTWQKSATPAVKDAWQLAAELLQHANEIRILGFSLPESDGYMKYLISLGAMRAPHLKALDVVCLDPDGSVANRYREFITYPRMRFADVDLKNYLRRLVEDMNTADFHGEKIVRFDRLEHIHRQCMLDASA